MQELDGRVALVTGASRGIGEVIAWALRAEGMRLVLAARSRTELERVAGSLDHGGQTVHVVECDVRDPASCEAAVRSATARFGVLDVLVNNAGVETPEPFAEMSMERIAQLVEVNVLGVMRMTRAALPHFLDRGQGNIVNLASLAGLLPIPYNTVYSATKHAVVGFSDSLRLELEATGVIVSSVSPGFVREVGMFTRYGQSAPALAGTSAPEEVAQAVVRALRRGSRNELVVPVRARPVPALRALAPGLVARGMRLGGVYQMLERTARANAAGGRRPRLAE